MKKKIITLLFALLTILPACSLTHPGQRYGADAPKYSVALLPWHSSTMDFTYRYRWTMTQGLLKAAAQAGNFKLVSSAYYADPQYAVKLLDIPKEQTAKLWVRHKYGRYLPDQKIVLSMLKNSGADLGILYDVNADNGNIGADDSANKPDSIRVFLIDATTGKTISAFRRTNFLGGAGFVDSKQINLQVFDKFMAADPTEQ